MQQTHDTGAGRPPGGRRLTRRPIRIPDDERTDLQHLLAEYTEALDERLEAGIRSLHRAAHELMRQLAAEVWRAGGPAAGRNLRDNVMAALAHDDTIKGLLAHTDERYQSLRVRLSQMESGVRELAETVRDVLGNVRRRADQLDRALEAAGAAPAAVGRVERALGPLAARVDTVGTALRRSQERQRDDLVRFGRRTAEALTEATRRIQRHLSGEIQRIEAAVRSETAFAVETTAELRGQADAVAERTGTVLEALRADLAARSDEAVARVESLERGNDEVRRALGQLSRIPTRLAELERRQREELDRAGRIWREDLEVYAKRAAGGIEEVGRRIDRGLGAALARIEEAERAEEARVGSLHETIGEQGERLEGFARSAAAGLDEVSRRIGDGFRLVLERAERASREAGVEVAREVREEVGRIESRIEEVAERTGSVLETTHADLALRVEESARDTRDRAIDLVTQLTGRQAGQHARNLEAITETLRTLLHSVRAAGERQSTAMERVLRASAGRQEAILQEALAALRGAVEELTGSHLAPEESSRPRTDAAAFTRRLRGVEHRLEQLSKELTAGIPPVP